MGQVSRYNSVLIGIGWIFMLIGMVFVLNCFYQRL